MTLHVALTHKTTYRYDRSVALGPQVIRLRPAPHCRTPVLSYSLNLKPAGHFLNWQQDPFGNYLARMVSNEKTNIFEVTVDLVADMAVINPFNFFMTEAAETWPFQYSSRQRAELLPYLKKEKHGKAFKALVAEFSKKDLRTIDYLPWLNQALEQKIGYLVREEPGIQTPDETLKLGCGSCRDTGWLLVQILRHLGLAARFVSGYLIQLTPDVKSLDGPSGTDTDFTDLHAWAEVYVPGAGWIGLDPTSGLLTGEGHIPLAAAPSPLSASPITGSHDKAEVTFDFAMNVKRIAESPRVTKPYSEQQWQDINTLGQAIDKRLEKSDVRLTMGGEPTFISIDDHEGEAWNTGAVSADKQKLADQLTRRLQARFAKGGLLHFGQGKWYPGEQLPRWSNNIYWRHDNEQLWNDPALISAPDTDDGTPLPPVSPKAALAFSKHLAKNLGLNPVNVAPAFEDLAHFALAEQNLPVGLDPCDNKLEDPLERARMVRVFERGLSAPSAYILPIQPWQARDGQRRWQSENWTLRRDRLFLLPGDSPAGLRLPLGALPHLAKAGFPQIFPIDPAAAAAPLPSRKTLMQQQKPLKKGGKTQTKTPKDDIPVRTALTIEPRQGGLYVFLPPLQDAEDYAALVGAVETTAEAQNQPIILEGYKPPADPRLNSLSVTPDPGVIEVNIHPSKSWDEAVSITETLYEEARLCRLGTEKFLLDGRHTGTGGGNHIVMGGQTPSDSPFLRRPDLLASLITYWQHHPSLSYLFSGLFIGPTSQAPRVDEARHDTLYELEIALAQLPATAPATDDVPPWLIDRLFRNLLTDSTGNTHRAEICIDKLFSPDGPAGRQGLVEFRSFEMPPHAHMSLAQQLLLRAIICRLWDAPYQQKLMRWGTRLHDRFMLPHFVTNDFYDVLDDLAGHGLELDKQWFAPHIEFRFPLVGNAVFQGVEIELRTALEPWHVLGEEGAPGGTARYVDSSLERLQIKVHNENPDRYQVTCNTQPLPLGNTQRNDEQVAGVRFRSWQPPHCLHPNIPVHAPLVFDVFDTWNQRSIGGCRYHVAHPGGRGSDTFPVNAFEAEGRRLGRFETLGHTPGMFTPKDLSPNPDFPLTLDLRRPLS